MPYREDEPENLIPEFESVDFEIGVPSNPCPGIDYSGVNPDPVYPKYPKNWHCQTNNNGIAGPSGGFEQNCDDLAAFRITVVEDDYLPRRIIRLTGGLPGKAGGAELARPLSRAVTWGSGEGISYNFTARFSSYPPSKRYFNMESRGILNFQAHKNESVECLGLHVGEDQIMVAWWLNAHDDSRVDEARYELKIPMHLEKDQWHRLQMVMIPLATPDTWQASFKIRSRGGLIWKYESTEGIHPNNVHSMTYVVLGDERKRDEDGGVTDIARVQVQVLTGFP